MASTLKPIHYEGIERQLADIFRWILFDPIVGVISQTSYALDVKKFFNSAEDDIRAALRSGRIQYQDGEFTGTLSAKISKALRALGARFDKRSKSYKLKALDIPTFVREEAAFYKTKSEEAHRTIERQLDYVQQNLGQLLDRAKVNPRRMVDQVVKDFRDVAEKIEVSPKLSEESKARLAEDYTDNMKLWIQKWCEEEISELRGVVEDNAIEGYRFSRLVDRIKNRWSVSESKAKFLARQETALFMSKFREQRFKEADVTHYRWSTSGDERVRTDHKKLNGRVFAYDDPPITDDATGARNNPGADFNCRCVDIPILIPLVKVSQNG